MLESTTEGVIIMFTAGDLDFLVRKAIASGESSISDHL